MKGSGRKVTATMSGALHAVRQSVLSPAAFTGSEEEEEEPEQCADTAIKPQITDENCNIKPVNMISDWTDTTYVL